MKYFYINFFKFIFLIILQFSFILAKSQQKNVDFNWNEYGMYFTTSAANFKTGWDTLYDFNGNKIAIQIEDFHEQITPNIADTLGWFNKGLTLEKNPKYAPGKTLYMFYKNGNLKAKISVLPHFVKSLEYYLDNPVVEDVYFENEFGEMELLTIATQKHVYIINETNEFYVIKHGETTYYDTLGNKICKGEYNFNKLIKGKEPFYSYKNTAQLGYFIPYVLDNEIYLAKHFLTDTLSWSILKQDETGVVLDRRIIKNILQYDNVKVNDSIRVERLYMPNGKDIKEECRYKNEKPFGFYFKLNDNGDTLSCGNFKDGYRDGFWRYLFIKDSVSYSENGNYYNGLKIGKHHFFANGVEYKRELYNEFSTSTFVYNENLLPKIIKETNTFIAKTNEWYFYPNGKIKQEIKFRPYHFSNDSRGYGGILSGVYFRDTAITLPKSLYPNYSKKEDLYFYPESKIDYLPNGKIESKLIHSNSYEWDGVNIEYDEFGVLISKEQFHKGKLDGWQYTYDKDGNITEKTQYFKGLAHGKVKQYDRYFNYFYGYNLTGNLPDSLNKNNTKKYLQKSYYPNGNLKFQGVLIPEKYSTNSTPFGTHTYYYETGIFKEVREYQDSIVLISLYNEKGNKISTIYYLNLGFPSDYIFDKGYLKPNYLSLKKHGLATYFDELGNVYKTEKYFLDELMETSDTNSNAVFADWTDLKLEGADATAFYIDKKGHYWLGTGSSGGVYLSKNKGKSWSAVNNGIGPVHVSLIGEVDGKLYMEIPGMRDDDYDLLYVLYKNTWKLFDKSIHQWEIKYALINHANKDFNISPFKKQQLSLDDDFLFYPSDKFKAKYFKWSNDEILVAKDSTKYFPLLMDQIGGNYKKISAKKAIVYGKSGIYTYNQKSTQHLPTKGLFANDVREIFVDSKNKIWCIVGLGDVYLLEGEKWTKIFDFYAQQNDYSKLSSLTANITEINGEIFFYSQGNIWQISNNTTVLFKPNCYGIAGNSLQDYYFLADMDVNYEKTRLLKHFNGNTVIVNDSTNENLNVFNAILKTSPIGEIWLVNAKNIKNLSTGEALNFVEELADVNVTANSISFNEQGDFVFIYAENELVYYTKHNGFMVKKVSHLEGLSSIALTNNGDIFGGTGYVFNISCGVDKVGNAQGIYQLNKNNHWDKISNNVNPWIMSINVLNDTNLLIGTSGTGLQLLTFPKK